MKLPRQAQLSPRLRDEVGWIRASLFRHRDFSTLGGIGKISLATLVAAKIALWEDDWKDDDHHTAPFQHLITTRPEFADYTTEMFKKEDKNTSHYMDVAPKMPDLNQDDNGYMDISPDTGADNNV